MREVVTQLAPLWNEVRNDPALRNCVALAVCVVLFLVFANRDSRRGAGRVHYSRMRGPDSVLRDAPARR